MLYDKDNDILINKKSTLKNIQSTSITKILIKSTSNGVFQVSKSNLFKYGHMEIIHISMLFGMGDRGQT